MGQIRFKEISKIKDLKIIGIHDPNIKSKKNIEKNLIIQNYNQIYKLKFDIAFVCTPNNVSSKIIIDCLKLNKKIFCEKPPAKSINEMNKIKKYLKKNTKLMFGFNHRFHPAVIKAKNIIDNKKFGNVITVREIYGKSGGINFRNS
jgi:Predicted dehydrogenases and related proteins